MKAYIDAKSLKTRGMRLFRSDLNDDNVICDDAPMLCELYDWMESIEENDSRVTQNLSVDQLVLVDTIKTTILSTTAYEFLEEAMDHGWSIDMADLGSHDYHIDMPELKITLNSSGLSGLSLSRSKYFRSQLTVALIRALRDIWQEERHGGFENHYGPEHILQLERMRSADCEAVLALCAWEIDCQGQPGIWRHFLASSEGDIALAFKKSLPIKGIKSEQDIYDAMSAAFTQWYASADRLHVCDHETLEYLDQLLLDDEFEGFSNASLTAAYVETLSCLPDNAAYLQNFSAQILFTPIYSAIDDQINHSHLMQIIQDTETTDVHGILFRDAELAAKIFPESMVKTSIHA